MTFHAFTPLAPTSPVQCEQTAGGQTWAPGRASIAAQSS